MITEKTNYNTTISKNPQKIQGEYFNSRFFYFLLFIILTTKIIAAIFIPFTDDSEARYAEIARKLLETKDWITLYHDYGIPFWAKPPLSTWLSAIGMYLFGVNEFAARIPILLLSIVLVSLVFHIAKTQYKRNFPEVSVLILFTCLGFYTFSTAVMTDMTFTFSITLSMIAFWQAMQVNTSPSTPPLHRFIQWRYVFFIGLGIGLLSKGIISIVLIGFPLLLWVILKRNIKEIWQKLPWIKGSILALAIAAPWYILAELKTPGFLNYFIIGEHFSRFFVSGWSGDLYGSAHSKDIGAIWLFWLFLTLPWSLWFMTIITLKIRRLKSLFLVNDFVLYLLCWTFAPLIFFTFCRNIITTYPLPSLPAFALLLGYLITEGVNRSCKLRFTFLAAVVFIPILTICITIYYQFNQCCWSDKGLVYDVMRSYPDSSLVYLKLVPHSAMFYSRGKARRQELTYIKQHLLSNDGKMFVALDKKQIQSLGPLLAQFKQVKEHCWMILLESMDTK